MTSEHKYRVDLVSLHCLLPIIKQQVVRLTHVTNHSGIHHNSSFPVWGLFLSKYIHIHTNLYSAKNRENEYEALNASAFPSSVRCAPSLLQFRRDLKTALHVSVIVLFTVVSSCVTDCNCYYCKVPL